MDDDARMKLRDELAKALKLDSAAASVEDKLWKCRISAIDAISEIQAQFDENEAVQDLFKNLIVGVTNCFYTFSNERRELARKVSDDLGLVDALLNECVRGNGCMVNCSILAKRYACDTEKIWRYLHLLIEEGFVQGEKLDDGVSIVGLTQKGKDYLGPPKPKTWVVVGRNAAGKSQRVTVEISPASDEEVLPLPSVLPPSLRSVFP